jgi:hypothetical protein
VKLLDEGATRAFGDSETLELVVGESEFAGGDVLL